MSENSHDQNGSFNPPPKRESVRSLGSGPPPSIMKIRSADSVQPEFVLYHYTTLQSYQAMLQSAELWLSNARSLNDRQEVTYAINLFCDGILQGLVVCEFRQELVNAIWRFLSAKIPEDIFLFSLTENISQLSQWRAYSAPCGVAVGYPIEVLNSFAKSNSGFVRKVTYEPIAQFEKLRHLAEQCCREITLKIINSDLQATNKIFERVLIPHFWDIAVTLKHPAFHEESESRIVIREPDKSRIKFRTSEKRITPYISRNILKLDDSCPVRTPVYNIIVGPMQYELETINNISKQLDAKKIDYNMVMGSGIPYQSTS